MIVRRFNRETGAEVAPVSVKQAAWAIARALMESPHAVDAAIVGDQLRAGEQLTSRRYRYVPDADQPEAVA